jgi:hypothetical protein
MKANRGEYYTIKVLLTFIKDYMILTLKSMHMQTSVLHNKVMEILQA